MQLGVGSIACDYSLQALQLLRGKMLYFSQRVLLLKVALPIQIGSLHITEPCVRAAS